MMKLNIQKISLGLLLIGLSLGVSSCKKKDEQEKKNSHKIYVMSSFSIITDMVKEIGKDSVEVHNLVPIGTDPHDYDPVPDDIKFATKTDLFIYNGLQLEGGDQGWFAKLIDAVGANPKKVYKASEGVPPLYLSGNHGEEEVNPHAFVSPVVGIRMAQNIKKALIEKDKRHEDFYAKNAKEYIDKLKKVEKEYQEKLLEIPEEDRVFIASEQAFQYVVEHYHLTGGFIWAIDTDEVGTPQQIKRAITFVREHNPPVLFVESNVDKRPMKTVSRETGVPVYSPAIFSDELGKPGETADNYIDYLKYNLKHIYNGLSGATSRE